MLGNSKREVLERKRIGKYILLVSLPLFAVSFIAMALKFASGESVWSVSMGLFYLSVFAAMIGICFYWNVIPGPSPFYVTPVPWGTGYNLPKWLEKIIYIMTVLLALFIVAMMIFLANK